MAVNKVVYNGNTLVDLTGDSVTPDTLAEGVTAHGADGQRMAGTMTAVQYGKSQSLTTTQKTQARTNIGAASAEAVSHLSQALAEIGTQEEIVQQVIAALGTPVFGRVDADKNVFLTAKNLAEGTYTYYFEGENGNRLIGTDTVAGEPTYTNVIPLSVGEDGSVFNGTGYLDGYRLTANYGSSVPHYVSANEEYFVTGYIQYTVENCKNCIPFYIKGVDLDTVGTYCRMSMHKNLASTAEARIADLSNTGANGFTIKKLGDKYYKIIPRENLYTTGGTTNGWNAIGATLTRFSFAGSGAGVILTINEPIE